MTLIPPQEAEKYEKDSEYTANFKDGVELANTVYDEKIMPVFEKCMTTLEKYKFRIETEITLEESAKIRNGLKLELVEIYSALSELNELLTEKT